MLCCFSLSLFAQDKPMMAEKGEAAEGMTFVEKPFDELLALAKKEDKVIFIDAYTTWCGPCKMMAITSVSLTLSSTWKRAKGPLLLNATA